MNCPRCARTIEMLRREIAKIELDERFHDEPAPVEVNAPLALIQVGLETRYRLATSILDALERTLE